MIWAWAVAHRISLRVPAGARPTIARLALPNVIVWHLLAILAVKMLPSGRAAILGYTMPVWAVVFGLLVLNERPLRRHWLGVIAAAIGIVLLLASELTSLAGAPIGTPLMLTAAAAWGYGTHLMRRRLTGMPIIALTFWMLVPTLGVLIGAVTILPHGYRETALRAIRGAQTIEVEERGPVPARAAP